MYRWGKANEPEVFLVHPGGPFWVKKDLGAWTIAKGEQNEGETPLETARREFTEETGFVAEGEFLELGEVRQAGGKVVTAWAFVGDCDPEKLTSNRVSIGWPPRSGRTIEIPEVDRGAWFSLAEARERILKSQVEFLDRLAQRVR
jgi:predicted NUDIX family NTP pyrophosphohydrolase